MTLNIIPPVFYLINPAATLLCRWLPKVRKIGTDRRHSAPVLPHLKLLEIVSGRHSDQVKKNPNACKIAIHHVVPVHTIARNQVRRHKILLRPIALVKVLLHHSLMLSLEVLLIAVIIGVTLA